MKIAILHHPSDAAAAEECRKHLFWLRWKGHEVATVAGVQADGADLSVVLLSADMAEAIGAGAVSGYCVPVFIRSCRPPPSMSGLEPLPRSGRPDGEEVTIGQ